MSYCYTKYTENKHNNTIKKFNTHGGDSTTEEGRKTSYQCELNQD